MSAPTPKPSDEDVSAALSSMSNAAESSGRLARWFNRWNDNRLGWHKDTVHPLLQKQHEQILNSHTTLASGTESQEEEEKKLRLFVPLCGKSVDMTFLAEHPAVEEVVGIDGIRKALVEFAEENPSLQIREVDSQRGVEGSIAAKFIGNSISLIKADFFDLNAESTGGLFDVIWDRASIVAIDPSLREQYVEIIGHLIKPGGTILLVTFLGNSGSEEAKRTGPPFTIDEGDVRSLFGNRDWVESVSLVDEMDGIGDEDSRKMWSTRGIFSIAELCFVIKSKKWQ